MDAPVDYDIPGKAKAAGKPRVPVSTGRDPNENRIQVIEVLHKVKNLANQR